MTPPSNSGRRREGIEAEVQSDPDVEPMTPYLGIHVPKEKWVCRKCGEILKDATENFKKGLRVRERDPAEIHQTLISDEYKYTYQPDSDWCRILEYYCPNCATMVEVEYLPPGHPPANEIEPDLEDIRRRHQNQSTKSDTNDAQN